MPGLQDPCPQNGVRWDSHVSEVSETHGLDAPPDENAEEKRPDVGEGLCPIWNGLLALEQEKPMSYRDEHWWLRNGGDPCNDGSIRIDTGEGEFGTTIVWLKNTYGVNGCKDGWEEKKTVARYICEAVNAYQKTGNGAQPDQELDVVVVGHDPLLRKKVTCPKCGAILSYLPKAVKNTRITINSTGGYTGENAVCPFVPCPCGHPVMVKI